MALGTDDEASQTYTMSAYLIAQLGKNFTEGAEKRISGADLLELAWSVVERIQYMSGGVVVFLKLNNEEILKEFYKENKFRQFDIRQAESKEEEPHELMQMLRLL